VSKHRMLSVLGADVIVTKANLRRCRMIGMAAQRATSALLIPSYVQEATLVWTNLVSKQRMLSVLGADVIVTTANLRRCRMIGIAALRATSALLIPSWQSRQRSALLGWRQALKSRTRSIAKSGQMRRFVVIVLVLRCLI